MIIIHYLNSYKLLQFLFSIPSYINKNPALAARDKFDLIGVTVITLRYFTRKHSMRGKARITILISFFFKCVHPHYKACTFSLQGHFFVPVLAIVEEQKETNIISVFVILLT